MDSYRVPAENFDALQIELNRINKRSAKCGTAGFELVVQNTEIEPLPTGEVRVFYIVCIKGEAPKIAGYSFMARLDHNTDPSGASNLVYSMPGVTLTQEQRALPASCEHCGRKRFRRDTYLLQEEATGKVIQVGRSCIKDFIGHDPEKLLKYAAGLILLINHAKSASEYDFQMNNWRTVTISHFLAYVSLAIRSYGWVSGKEAYEHHKESTKDTAWNIMKGSVGGFAHNSVVLTDADQQTAQEVLTWVLQQPKSQSDFIHNLVTLAETGYIDYKSAGTAAAAVQVYNKAMETTKITTFDFSKSQHVGAKGDRLTLDVTVYGKSYGQGTFGPWTRVSMIDATGNVYVTFAGGKFDPAKDSTIKIRGTVKDHGEFKGIKQTNLSRVAELTKN